MPTEKLGTHTPSTPDTRDTRSRGAQNETRAAAHLSAAGLEILDRNVTLAGAELDLVACERGEDGLCTLVFVEVRSRASARRGHPLETVGARKQARVIRAAKAWLSGRGLWERVAVRFDVVGLVGRDEPEICWIRGAFEPR